MPLITKGILMIGLCFSLSSQVWAQDEGTRLRVAVREDGRAYVYHTAIPPLGYGMNVYRQNGSGSEFIKLNEQPVYGARSEGELRARLGGIYYNLISQMGVEVNQGVLFSLRGNRTNGLLYTFIYPEVAKELMRLYIDEDAPAGQTVTYRIDFVDPLQEEVVESIRQEVALEQHQIAAPSNLRMENEGETVTLRWGYPINGEGEDDKVIRFDVFRRNIQGDSVRVNRNPVIRNEANEDQVFSFTHSSSQSSVEFFVRPYDITGQAGPDSRAVTHTFEDNVEPVFITGVEAIALEDGTVIVTWPVSTEQDVQGYNVYRARSVEEDAPLTKINDRPVGLLETTFRDSTLSVSAPRVFIYRVTAVDLAGNESEPSSAATVQVEDKVAPPAPFDARVEYADEGTVRIHWQAPSMPIDFKTFVVMRRRLGKQAEQLPARIHEEDIAGTEWSDHILAVGGPVEGTEYEYSVAAADSARNTSEAVYASLAIPNRLPPAPPAAFRVENEQGIRAVIRWTKPDDHDIAFFTIYRTDPDGGDERRFRVSGDGLIYRDEEVELAQRYIYRATTTDVADNESAFTEADTVFVRNYQVPRSVRNVRAGVTSQGVHIRWEPVPDPDLAGYRVFRSSIATGTFEPVTEDLIHSREYTDPEGEESHWYRVRAYNTSANESLPSEPAQARVTQE